MSIYAVLPLTREYTLPSNTFGATHSMPLRRSSGGSISASYGLKLELESSFLPKIVKLVEGHWVKAHRIFVERLCYVDGSSLYPYRIRYISPTQRYDKIVVLPKMLEMIHYGLQGYPHRMMTPLDYYIKNLRPGFLNVQPAVMYQGLVSGICCDDTTWQNAFRRIDEFNIAKLDPASTYLWMNEDIDNDICRKMGMILPTKDGLTLKTLEEPIRKSEIAAHFGAAPLTDVSQPLAIQIDNPYKTEFTPANHGSVVDNLNHISYTDLEIEYILSNGTPIGYDVGQLYDRYDRNSDMTMTRMLVGMTIMNCIMAAKFSPLAGDLYGDIRCVIKKTYNDEALISFYNKEDDTLLYACHYDLALASLCSPGVITFPIPFPEAI